MKIILTAFICLACSLLTTAQDSIDFSKWDIKASHSFIIIYHGADLSFNPSLFSINGNYRLNKKYDVGLYLGAGVLDYVQGPEGNLVGLEKMTYFFGMDGSVHLLPLFEIDKLKWLDVYLNGRFGGFYRPVDDSWFGDKGFEAEYGLGAGCAVFITENLGLYAEYAYGNYMYKNNERLYLGVNIRF